MNFKRFLCVVFCLMGVSLAHAFHPEDGIDLATTLTRFNFVEYDDLQKKAVQERGWLYGGELEARKTFGAFFIEGSAAMHKGTVRYDGLTQSGDPHATLTTETVQDASIQIGRIYEAWRRHDYAIIYAGAGIHQWARDIKTNNDVAGLYEIYTWGYVNVGARGFILRFANVRMMAELNLLRTLFPVMDVSFGGKYDNMRVKLGEHYGAKFSLPVHIDLTRQFQLGLEPFLEAWDLGRSEHKELTQQGFVAGTMHEPRSESRNYGVNVGLQFRFD